MEPRYRMVALCAFALSGCTSERAALSANDAEVMGEDESDPEMERSPTEIPSGWSEVKGGCGLSLTGPSLIARSLQGADSCVTMFASPECEYHADFGAYSSPLAGPKDEHYESEALRIHGRPASVQRSIGPDAEGNFNVGVFVPSVWSPGTTPAVSVIARCGSAEAQSTARDVLRTLALPKDAAAAAVPLLPTSDCSGYDERPIEGYALSDACVDQKMRVPGVCALGAKTHSASGSGQMLCFVTPGGTYYWAQVAYGEWVVGSGAKHGPGDLWQDELEPEQSARCAALIAARKSAAGASFNALTGEYSAPPCP